MVAGRRFAATSGILGLVATLFQLPIAPGLQCYGCNVLVGARSVDTGCASPEVITCSHSHQGFKHRFCIKMESVVLGILFASGCATSRHCQQQDLPGVRIHCCDRDLCNGSPRVALLPGVSLLTGCLLLSWVSSGPL